MQKRILSAMVLALTLLMIVQSASMARAIPRCVRLRHLIYVATTTTTLADIANQIGGKKVLVTPLLKANQDFTNPRIYKSMKHTVREAEVFVRLGSGFDPWMHELLKTSGNKTITPGSKLDVDSSAGIPKLESTNSLGYYWLDPVNGKIIAADIMAGLAAFSPRDADYFKQRYEAFCRKLDESIPKWQGKLAPYKGTKVVTCCKERGVFDSRFGLVGVAAIESRHGIEPTGEQVSAAISVLKDEPGVKPVIVESVCPIDAAQALAGELSVRIVELPSAVKSKKRIRNYFDLFDEMTATLQRALSVASDDNKF